MRDNIYAFVAGVTLGTICGIAIANLNLEAIKP